MLNDISHDNKYTSDIGIKISKTLMRLDSFLGMKAKRVVLTCYVSFGDLYI